MDSVWSALTHVHVLMLGRDCYAKLANKSDIHDSRDEKNTISAF